MTIQPHVATKSAGVARTKLEDRLEKEGEGVVHEHIQEEAESGCQQPRSLQFTGKLDGCTGDDRTDMPSRQAHTADYSCRTQTPT